MIKRRKIVTALTIAGSDSGGGAGIQADLKTFLALDVYGTSVITCVTAQNTKGIFGIHHVDSHSVKQQLEAVLSDIGVHAVKTGMLFHSEIIETVVRILKKYAVKKLVVDPVMVSKNGTELLQGDALPVLVRELLPLAYVVTPNIPEAEVLTGTAIHSVGDMESACRTLHAMGCRAVVVKGGHLAGNAVDVLFDGKKLYYFKSQRLRTKHTHGTGCTFSAAITAYLAKGFGLIESVKHAKTFVTAAIGKSLKIGQGQGPVNPLHALKF